MIDTIWLTLNLSFIKLTNYSSSEFAFALQMATKIKLIIKSNTTRPVFSNYAREHAYGIPYIQNGIGRSKYKIWKRRKALTELARCPAAVSGYIHPFWDHWIKFPLAAFFFRMIHPTSYITHTEARLTSTLIWSADVKWLVFFFRLGW